MARKTAEPAPVAEAPAPLPEGVQEGDSSAGARPGPKAPAKFQNGGEAPQTHANGAIGQPSAKDMNERQWSAKHSKLREMAYAEGAKTESPSSVPLFGTKLDPDAPIEEPKDRVGPAPVEAEPEKPVEAKPKSTDAELARIAEAEAENRRLKKEMKKITEAPKGLRLEKLKELVKTNPQGVADMLGLDLADLNIRTIRGEKYDPVKLEDDKPTEPQVDEEKESLRARAQAAEQREARRVVNETAEALVKDTKVDGKLKWPLVAQLGQEARDAAVNQAFRFARGEIDEKGAVLERPRRMKPMSEDDAKEVLSHFLDAENTRLTGLAKKLGAAAQKPEPRVVQRGGGARSPLSVTPEQARAKKSYIEIGEDVRARFFGPR